VLCCTSKHRSPINLALPRHHHTTHSIQTQHKVKPTIRTTSSTCALTKSMTTAINRVFLSPPQLNTTASIRCASLLPLNTNSQGATSKGNTAYKKRLMIIMMWRKQTKQQTYLMTTTVHTKLLHAPCPQHNTHCDPKSLTPNMGTVRQEAHLRSTHSYNVIEHKVNIQQSHNSQSPNTLPWDRGHFSVIHNHVRSPCKTTQ
jgi:hypothetical protein